MNFVFHSLKFSLEKAPLSSSETLYHSVNDTLLSCFLGSYFDKTSVYLGVELCCKTPKWRTQRFPDPAGISKSSPLWSTSWKLYQKDTDLLFQTAGDTTCISLPNCLCRQMVSYTKGICSFLPIFVSCPVSKISARSLFYRC